MRQFKSARIVFVTLFCVFGLMALLATGLAFASGTRLSSTTANASAGAVSEAIATAIDLNRKRATLTRKRGESAVRDSSSRGQVSHDRVR